MEATGSWSGGALQAYAVADGGSGERVEAHEPPDETPGRSPLGHTARFVVDHASSCDVVVLSL